jgi:hypothetical protein
MLRVGALPRPIAMTSRPIVAVFTAMLLAAPAFAQGGRGRGRAEEVQNRVGAFFVDAPAPAAAADGKAGDLAATEFVRAAAAKGQPAVLYLVDTRDDQDVRDQFERALFGGDEIGILLRPFHCGRIDLKAVPELAAKFGKQAPLCVAFDKDGKAGEVVAMSGYKASTKALETALGKAATGVVKPSLPAFAKEYGGFVRDFEALLARKKLASEKLARAGADKGKRADAEKDLAGIEKDEAKLLASEQQILGKAPLVERPADAKRLGGRAFGGMGGGAGGAGGGGAGAGGGGTRGG